MRDREVLPVVLAAGRGSRLAPRTDHVPKPLLPVRGRPILWYVLKSLRESLDVRPAVAIGYKANVIRAYCADWDAAFYDTSQQSMAEGFFDVVDRRSAAVYFGQSADTLAPPSIMRDAIHQCLESKYPCHVAFVRLAARGHKSWAFEEQHGRLVGLKRGQQRTSLERVALRLDREAVDVLMERLPRPVTEESLPADMKPYQTGWNLFLKVLLDADVPIGMSWCEGEVMNINTEDDLAKARDFVSPWLVASD